MLRISEAVQTCRSRSEVGSGAGRSPEEDCDIRDRIDGRKCKERKRENRTECCLVNSKVVGCETREPGRGPLDSKASALALLVIYYPVPETIQQ